MEKHEELLGMQFEIPGQPERKKNNRRKATEIKRMFNCPVAGCHKGYGSESTLKHHLRVKHSEINKASENKAVKVEKTVPDIIKLEADHLNVVVRNNVPVQ